MITAVAGVDWPSLTRRCSALFLSSTTIDIVALLVGQHGGARHRQRLDRLDALDQHGDELAVDQRAVTGLPASIGLSGGLGIVPRTRIVSVVACTLGST